MNETIDRRFNDIYSKTYSNTLKYIVSKCDNLSNVEDIMQNVYIRLYKIMSKKNNYINNYEAFLIKLSKNELFKYYSFKNKIRVVFNIDLDNNEQESINNIKDESINIENTVLKNISLDNIWELIKEQDILTQKIIALYYMEELKIKEIAHILKLNESTVKTKIYRTIQKLKEEFGKGVGKYE